MSKKGAMDLVEKLDAGEFNGRRKGEFERIATVCRWWLYGRMHGDVEEHIAKRVDFEFGVADELRQMDARIFREEPMGLKESTDWN